MARVSKLLVANRGEIARRIVRTAKAMGIGTVAVFSEPDARSALLGEADEAVALRGSSPTDTYLDVQSLIEAARSTGCDAVHPGYGFLSERPELARACAGAGLAWLGPPAEVIEAMASKTRAKALMAGAGVPVLPAEELTPQIVVEPSQLARAAERIGLPLLVKATFGGGGRGMRVVRDLSELGEAVGSAAREAGSSFGDSSVFLERYIEAPRHVEVQILGDEHGQLVHLFERECSVQRRFQKVVEESPSPAVDPTLRAALGEVAVAGAKALGYVGAGTVEFLLDSDQSFYFLEVNTRLQVEHPVTEAVTGLDLVELQIRVARGEHLPASVLEASMSGHAIEARVYAEDVGTGFAPASGPLHLVDLPAGPGLRVDSGYESGSTMSPFYDAMIAKVIAWAPSREAAASRLASALRRMRVHGVPTNRDLLVGVLRDPDFLAGRTDTGMLERQGPRGLAQQIDLEGRRIHALAAALSGQAARRRASLVQRHIPSGWRNVPTALQVATYDDGSARFEVRYRVGATPSRGFEVALEVDGEPVPGAAVWDASPEGVDLTVDGVRHRIEVQQVGSTSYVDSVLGSSVLREVERFPPAAVAQASGSLLAPLPGTVARVLARPGDHVSAGQRLLVLEAMKMEHQVEAPRSGVVVELRVGAGDQVDTGEVLAVLEEARDGE